MEMPTETATLTCYRVEDEPTYLIHIQHPTRECYDVTADEPVLNKKLHQDRFMEHVHSILSRHLVAANQEQLEPICGD